jgi:hypothetical protein
LAPRTLYWQIKRFTAFRADPKPEAGEVFIPVDRFGRIGPEPFGTKLGDADMGHIEKGALAKFLAYPKHQQACNSTIDAAPL